ncbi:LmeA family phospholipid-binding protein [Lyngbya aestuarii]|uniref:LmeA family phospholipid-binding protein n=1 Tax=Lyngbya aestuarii TaxID=118322 RepID=UPI00403E2CE2
MTQEGNSGIGEQALNKVAELSLSAKLNDAEVIDVDIESDALGLVQGEIDSVTVRGEGLVTPQDLRLEELQLQADNIAIDILSTALGKIELSHPIDASGRLVLTTADLNRALNSDYLRQQVRNLKIPLNNRRLIIDLQKVECSLPSKDKLVIQAKVIAHLVNKTQKANFRVVLSIRDGGEYIAFEQGQYLEGEDLPIEQTAALLTKINEILSLRYFRYQGMLLQMKRLEVDTDQVTVWIKAHVEQLPSA